MITAEGLSAAAVALAVAGAAAFPLRAADGDAQKAPNAVPIAANADFSVRLPQEEKLIFRGVASYDQAGAGSHSPLYPAPNAAGLLAAVITHGLLVESTKKNQKDKVQQAADEVLKPYASVLDSYTHRQLIELALQKTSAGGAKSIVQSASEAGTALLVETNPVFSMTQDQSAIVLDNEILIYQSGRTSAPLYRNAMRVVSGPKDAADPVEFWTAGAGEKLKAETSSLYAESLGIAFAEASGSLDAKGPFKTVRYPEGKTEKMERAQIVSARCDRQVIRTLRESLMSVPVRTVTADNCGTESK